MFQKSWFYLFQSKRFKNILKCFFTIKTHFALEIFKYLSLTSVFAGKRHDQKAKVNFKIYWNKNNYKTNIA